MAFCSKCGKEINDEAVVCIHCGCQTSKGAVSNNTDRPATGVEILLTVLWPILGAILYYVYKSNKPTASKQLNKVSIISFLAWFAIGFLLSVLAASAY